MNVTFRHAERNCARSDITRLLGGAPCITRSGSIFFHSRQRPAPRRGEEAETVIIAELRPDRSRGFECRRRSSSKFSVEAEDQPCDSRDSEAKERCRLSVI